MNFETVYAELPQRQIEPLARAQVKVKGSVELKTPCKQVLCVSSACFVTGTERSDAEVRVSGKVTTRVIYIDELDAYNSEERTDSFTEKFVLRNSAAVVSVTASALVLETVTADISKERADAETVIDLTLVGVTEKSVRFVTDVKGNADCKHEKMPVMILGKTVEERFSVDDRFDLDKNCEGVLGVDAAAYLRDITMGDGKITIKGGISANVIGVKSGETMAIFNSVHEFDFNKTVTMAGVGIDDAVSGTVSVTNIVVKAENKTKPELIVEVDLLFSGNVAVTQQVDFVTDAICFDNHIQLGSITVENNVMPNQVNTVADIEGNMTMAEGAPYISKILKVGAAGINSINIVPADSKVTIEGVVSAHIVYECEEKQIHSHMAQVPFTTTAKIDGIDARHSIAAAVQPLSCNIKARRGKELLVDARIGISLSASSVSTQNIIGEITAGEAKVADDSAIMIYLANPRETLWDIAKRISVPTSEIVKQNPHCADGVKAGDRIFIYRQQVINF